MVVTQLINALYNLRGPALTWYGENRIELGGSVAARWITKIVNFLGTDFSSDFFFDSLENSSSDANNDQAHGHIGVCLYNSWQSLLWTQAAWLSGWVTTDSLRDNTDILLCAKINDETQKALEQGCWVLAHELNPLSTTWQGYLPNEAIDALGALMAQSDQLEVDVETLKEHELDLSEKISTSDIYRDIQAFNHNPPTERMSITNNAHVQIDGTNISVSHKRVALSTHSRAKDASILIAYWLAGYSVIFIDPHHYEQKAQEKILTTEKASWGQRSTYTS